MDKVNLNGKNILVTGGLGFIGSNFIELILNKYSDMNIFNIDNQGVGSRDSFTPHCDKFNTYEHIFTSTELIDRNERFRHIKFDYIFHFAAHSHVDRSIMSPSGFVSSNVNGITAILEHMRKFQPTARMINISTDEVYGHLGFDDDAFTEDSPLNPRSPYSASKAAADLIANSYHTTYGLDIITTRCCNNFGPHQHDEKLIPTIIRNLVKGDKVPVYGKGDNVREWIYVDDHNKSILEIAHFGQGGTVYNISGDKEMNNLEMIAKVLQNVHPDKPFPPSQDYIEFVDDRKGHDLRYSLKSKRYFRTSQLRTFEDALKVTVDFYVDKYRRGN